MMAIAVVSMGEMGSGIAARLVENGVRVLTSLSGRSEASFSRARAAGVEIVDEVAMIEQASILLSIVPPSVAGETAEHFLPLIDRSSSKPVYLDCNATAPLTVLGIAKGFTERGLRFLDASIIGLPPKLKAASPRLYISGPVEREADVLRSFGLDTRVLSDVLGDASALKMAYAGINKGFQAIGVAMILGAARNGVAESLAAELEDSLPIHYNWLKKKLPGIYSKAYRWDGEMLEIAKFLEPEQGAVAMLMGAAELYKHVGEEYKEGAGSEMIGALDRFAGPLG